MSTVSLAMPAAVPMSTSRLLHAYWTEASYEIRRTLRTPAFVIPTVALPVLLYLFFAVMLNGARAAADPKVALYLLSGFAMFSVVGPGMFGIGIGFAVERQSGVVTLKRALPMPPAANLIGKLLSSMTLALMVIVLLMTLAVLFGHAQLTAAQSVKFALVGLLGVAPFCALGLLISTFVSGTAAPAIVNLIYFPMIYLSGLFPFGMSKTLQAAAVIWPAFHLNQLALSALGLPVTFDVWIAALVLLGLTAVCITIAARRLARVG